VEEVVCILAFYPIFVGSPLLSPKYIFHDGDNATGPGCTSDESRARGGRLRQMSVRDC
jgi:hypothetical protein